MKWLLALIAVALANCAGLPSSPVVSPEGVQRAIAVFDIDGTLTPRNAEIFTARPDAAKAVQILSDKGYRIVYLTARRPELQEPIPRWLQRHGFPAGDLQLAPDVASNKKPEPFKERVLQAYRGKQWQIAYAFGDSSTDFSAYAAVGVPTDRIFALRRSNESACLPGQYARCLNGWGEILQLLRSAPKIGE